jgi:hypothetical protein
MKYYFYRTETLYMLTSFLVERNEMQTIVASSKL